MMYRLYRVTNDEKKMCDTSCEHNVILTSYISPSICEGGLRGIIMALYWNIVSRYKGRVYFIKNEKNEIVHSSIVLRKCRKFNFLSASDVVIGPCKTHISYRGMNIYPYVLNYIISEEVADGGYAYIIVDDRNSSSLNGIKKVGFAEYKPVIKKGKRYYTD